jgi:hypothetical protein
MWTWWKMKKFVPETIDTMRQLYMENRTAIDFLALHGTETEKIQMELIKKIATGNALMI